MTTISNCSEYYDPRDSSTPEEVAPSEKLGLVAKIGTFVTGIVTRPSRAPRNDTKSRSEASDIVGDMRIQLLQNKILASRLDNRGEL